MIPIDYKEPKVDTNNDRQIIEFNGITKTTKTYLGRQGTLIEWDYGGGDYPYPFEHLKSHILSIPKNARIINFHLYLHNLPIGGLEDMSVINPSYFGILENFKELDNKPDYNCLKEGYYKKVSDDYNSYDLWKDILNHIKLGTKESGYYLAETEAEYDGNDTFRIGNHQIDYICYDDKNSDYSDTIHYVNGRTMYPTSSGYICLD